jgi:transcription-repair coupling factor (superfamily II helicase)
MSLLGIKDISSLETPPEGRRAIETAIARAHPGLIREAILREISRHGQVFFVHNRVQSIGRRAEELRRLVPEARFVVGHGQMHEDELAHRMLSFIGGEADVLVCTTIIESGIDIPRANTILIDRADRFGLSDLHQLRGRVGRYHNKAYAYMLLAPSGRASTTGLKRVRAIEEYQELGAGFKIAMRDLEIRGAGSLLGSSQSGFISLVGYDLYCRLLQQAVHEIRERGSIDKVRWQRKLGVAEAEGFDELTLDATMVDAQDHPELAFEKARFGERARARALGLEASVEVQLPLEARLSRRYIEDDRQRIEIYRKLANASSEKDIAALQAELTDRFGKPPEPAARLLRIAQLRILIEPLGVFRVTAEGKAAIVELDQKTHRFKAALSRAGVTGKWADPRTCYLIVSNKADPPANQVLERLLAIFAPSLRERARKSPRGRKKSGPRHPARRS